MPPRPRGKMHRGGGMRGHHGGGGHGRGHWDKDHGGGRGGGGGFHHRGRGRGGGHHRGRPDYYHGRRDSRSPPPQRHNPEKLLAGLGREAQLALTTAIINSVLKTDGREGRGNYRDRERFHHRDQRRDGRGGYFREESRDRRHYGDERRSHDQRPYHEEGRGHRYDREKSTSGSPRYRNNRYSGMPRRRPSPHGSQGQSRKRQRMERMDGSEGGSTPYHERDFEGEESFEQERERERPSKRRHRSQSSEGQSKERSERLEGGEEKEEGADSSSGMQVTIRADGERAVNNEGRVRPRVSGRLFVELKCPHCPSQKSITFKEYKFHLGSEGHKSQLNRLARKHSVVLRKIRMQQRQEQREIEEKWKEENPEEFKNAVSKFCVTCKLAFKCLGSNVSDGINLHNRTKLHRMQRHYLHPRCTVCRITFPSRMVYEYHIASINHLRVQTATIENSSGEGQKDEEDEEEDDDVDDLANFMTLDSVGEDDEEVGSEHEEITEGLEEAEAADKEVSRRKSSKGDRRKRSREDDELSLDPDWDKDNLDDDDEEEDDEGEPVGTMYVTRIEAYYCSLCCKIIRGDTSIGSRCVQRHCRSFDHLAHYQDAHPPTTEDQDDKDANGKSMGPKEIDMEGSSEVGEEDVNIAGEEGTSIAGEEETNKVDEEGVSKVGKEDVTNSEARDDNEGDEGDEYDDEGEEGDYEDDHDDQEEKLWEEVDQGLIALQGEIMSEIGEGDPKEDSKSIKDTEKEIDEAVEDSDEEGGMEIAERDHSDVESETENAELADDSKEQLADKDHDIEFKGKEEDVEGSDDDSKRKDV